MRETIISALNFRVSIVLAINMKNTRSFIYSQLNWWKKKEWKKKSLSHFCNKKICAILKDKMHLRGI